MKKHNWPYLAGLIDGEGCFSAWGYWNDSRTDCKPYWQYSCRANVTNTNLQLMKWLVKHFGGGYRLAREATAQHKARYEWRPKGKNNLKTLLLSTIPYLVAKKEQAKLLLEWVGLDYGSQERRTQIIKQLNILNQKGPVETDTLNGSPLENWVSYPETYTGTIPKIQSELTGDSKSDPMETLDS
jgi:hypothetical protein